MSPSRETVASIVLILSSFILRESKGLARILFSRRTSEYYIELQGIGVSVISGAAGDRGLNRKMNGPGSIIFALRASKSIRAGPLAPAVVPAS
jgi:hypothetical protein